MVRKGNRLGSWAFLIGLVIAVIVGFGLGGGLGQGMVITLFVIGLIVGLLNVADEETTPFLIASIALMLAGIVNLGLIPGVGIYLRSILSNIVVFVVPGAIILGMKAIWKLASE